MTKENYPFRAAPAIRRRAYRIALALGIGVAVLIGGVTFFFLARTDIALLVGGGFGLALAVMRYCAVSRSFHHLRANPPQFAGERIIIEDLADYRDGQSPNMLVYVCLTDRRLSWQYFPFDENSSSDYLPLEQLKFITPFNHLGLRPIGICLTTVNNRKHYLRLPFQREQWLEELYDAWKTLVHTSPGKHPIPQHPLPADSATVFTATGTIIPTGELRLNTHTDFPPGTVIAEVRLYNFQPTQPVNPYAPLN